LGQKYLNTTTPSNEDIEKAKIAENKSLNYRTATAITNPETLDLEVLSIEAKTKLQAKGRIEKLQNFTTDLTAVFSTTVNQQFNGEVKKAVEVLVKAPEGHLTSVEKMAEVRMSVLGGESQHIHNRLVGIGNNQLRERLDTTTDKLTDLHVNHGRALQDWLMDVVEGDEQQNLSELVECSLSSAEEIHYNLTTTIIEQAKMDKLDEMNRGDLINNLLAKKTTRQIYRLAGDIDKHLDRDDLDKERQIKRLVSNLNLEKLPDVCAE
jgi:hypothetical protein